MMITKLLIAMLMTTAAPPDSFNTNSYESPLNYIDSYPCSPCDEKEYESEKVGKNPLRLTRSRLNMAAVVVCMSLDYGADPYEMVAIAWVETRLNPNLINRGKDAGLFQVNCKINWKRFGYHKPFLHIKSKKRRRLKAINQCAEAQLNPEESFRNADHILRILRNKRSCRGDKVYSCYNGGPGWAIVHKKRATGYRKKVKRVKRILRKHYSGLFDFGC
mgnify:CR=1 FL=1